MSPRKLRLFCFPYAGGGSSVFKKWIPFFNGDLELYPVQIPGREELFHLPPFNSMSLLVEWLIEQLHKDFVPPFAFFGHSMGGLISFVLAQTLLKEKQLLPERIIISATRPPHLPQKNRPLHSLGVTEFKEEIRRYGRISPEFLNLPEFTELFLPNLRADFHLCETYRLDCMNPIPCPLTILGGLEDPFISPEELESWSDFTTQTCDQYMYEGDHFYLFSQEIDFKKQLKGLLYREGMKNRNMARRRPEFEPGHAGAEAAKLKKFSDAGGSQRQWLPDVARTDSSITSGICQI